MTTERERVLQLEVRRLKEEQRQTLVFRKPWDALPGWDLVGMNHYRQDGERRLFVAMTNAEGRCIREEGPDNVDLWDRLWRQVAAEVKP